MRREGTRCAVSRLILLLTLLTSGALIAQEHDFDDISPIEVHRQLIDVLLELEYLKLDHFKYDPYLPRERVD